VVSSCHQSKDSAETQEAMQKMSTAVDSNAASGTTSLGALLKAKLDNKTKLNLSHKVL
jgi:small subunit ribosomal protein S1